MNRDILKILGIISSVIYIITSLFFYFNPMQTNQSYSFGIFLHFINLLASAAIFFSISEIIKEFSTVNIASQVYFLIGFKVLYFILPFFSIGSEITIRGSNITYIIIILLIAVIAVKLLRIRNKEININSLKIFILSSLAIILLLNTFGYFLIKKIENPQKGIDLMHQLQILNIIPYFFASAFFIKPLKTEQTN